MFKFAHVSNCLKILLTFFLLLPRMGFARLTNYLIYIHFIGDVKPDHVLKSVKVKHLRRKTQFW